MNYVNLFDSCFEINEKKDFSFRLALIELKTQIRDLWKDSKILRVFHFVILCVN